MSEGRYVHPCTLATFSPSMDVISISEADTPGYLSTGFAGLTLSLLQESD